MSIKGFIIGGDTVKYNYPDCDNKIIVDASLSITGDAADAKATGDALNSRVNGGSFSWDIASLNPGSGTETTSTTRIRSWFVPVTLGTTIELVSPLNRLVVYCYGAYKQYISDSPWLTTNKFTISDESVFFVRILIRKDSSNSTISASEVNGLAQGLTISYALPKNVYTDQLKMGAIESALDGSRYVEVEIGSMSAGKPTDSTAYVRSKDFILANAGDTLTVAPKYFGIYYGAIYKYTVNNASGYTSSVTIPTVTANNTWKYVFTEKTWFKFRASNASSGANITADDLYKFDDVFHISHIYDSVELLKTVDPLDVDYDSINATITGKFNIAVQTDTHVSKFVGYTGDKYLPSDFNSIRSVAATVNNLEINVFANLGDFIRGYQCDPDFESRSNADAIIECYDAIRTNKAFVIGNHDDGCLYYANTVYNDKKNISQVMFPTEQFNRYTKYGVNNTGIKNYYYSEIAGVRIITLFQRDFDYSQSIPGIESFNIGATQLDWLTNTALNTTLPVLVLTHAPLVTSLYSTSRGGFDSVLSALTSFVSGGGTVIAVLSGHTHNRGAAKVDGINHIVFKNGYDFFEILSVDTSTRTISCSMVNSTLESRSFTY